MTQFVGLNTPPLANGLLYIYVNDTLVLAHTGTFTSTISSTFICSLLVFTGLVWRTDDSIYLSRILFSTFFGGSTASYNPKTNQSAYFRNFEVRSPPISLSSSHRRLQSAKLTTTLYDASGLARCQCIKHNRTSRKRDFVLRPKRK